MREFEDFNSNVKTLSLDRFCRRKTKINGIGIVSWHYCNYHH